ncbi:Stress response protein [Melia azedarach]|uniref:Stress response protein n=1 Tax=Melia azedarach TaxID=155640 RepID=A0ACC1YR45_MELAZ|nr:Stress response protein [Melia azedarach]
MAKNRNKNKRSGAVSMDINEPTVTDMPQAMDVSESGALKPASGMLSIKAQKGRPMKRSKNVRKKKAVEKAIAKSEKYIQKTLMKESKSFNAQSAKSLYD